MQNVTEAYKALIRTNDRSISIRMVIGAYVDESAAGDVTSITGSFLPMTNEDQIIDSNYDMQLGLATFEGMGIPTASGMSYVPPIAKTAYPPEVGIWSTGISSDTGALDWTMTVSLSAQHESGFAIYTSGPSITSGTVRFIDSTTSTSYTVALQCHEGVAIVSAKHTYTQLVVHITGIDQTFRHLRIAEVEFGEAVIVTADDLQDEVTWIDEIDPLWTAMPMAELDFSVVNVDGKYDEDNPNGLAEVMGIGNRMSASLTVKGTGVAQTIQLGRFVIGKKTAADTSVAVCAYDTRWLLMQTYKSWSLSTSQSIGASIEAQFVGLGIGYVIATAVYSIYPAQAHVFEAQKQSVYECMFVIAQAYGLSMQPNRGGNIEVKVGMPTDTYGDIPMSCQYSWPGVAQTERYNYIVVAYDDGENRTKYTVDLRDSTDKPMVSLNVDNPLVTTLVAATALANRLIAGMYSVMSDVEWMGDPAMDMGDSVTAHSRWTVGGTPRTWKAVKRELSYNGDVTEIVTLIR